MQFGYSTFDQSCPLPGPTGETGNIFSRVSFADLKSYCREKVRGLRTAESFTRASFAIIISWLMFLLPLQEKAKAAMKIVLGGFAICGGYMTYIGEEKFYREVIILTSYT